ncbi:MAG TPA: acetylornithine carbamoyltransferase [Saprospiraceae bacterium]|nr:acetylornithine carbamoyltransferase [Saprospiraceae bacterium]
MQKFTSVADVSNVEELVTLARDLKSRPQAHHHLGQHKTLGLIFLNPSLRTRLSTQKAGLNLGMNVIVMNMDKEGWALEFQDGAVMNGTTVEHIKDAAAVMGQYCDILGIRAFPTLKDREEDYGEHLLKKFIRHCKVPVVSLESATLHPLQSLADLITIREWQPDGRRPKVVLTWAPHIKALPQAVPNSFAEWMCCADLDFTIAHPKGLELAPQFTDGARILHDQHESLEDADFVYVKNWSAYEPYGQLYSGGEDWLLDNAKIAHTHQAKIMHCLPVRRNVELSDELLDGPQSLILEQANNRTFAAQAVLLQMLAEL